MHSTECVCSSHGTIKNALCNGSFETEIRVKYRKKHVYVIEIYYIYPNYLYLSLWSLKEGLKLYKPYFGANSKTEAEVCQMITETDIANPSGSAEENKTETNHTPSREYDQ